MPQGAGGHPHGGGGGGNQTNAEIAYNFFLHQGLSAAAAAGIVGNLMVESGLNPGAVGDNGSSFGIAQWHLGRADALKSRPNWQSLSTQLAFLWQELTTSYHNTLNGLRSAPSASAAAAVFASTYERPASTDYSNREAAATSVASASQTGNWSSVSSSTNTGGGGSTSVGGGHSTSTSTSTTVHPYQVDDYLHVLQSWGLPITPAMHAFAAWAAGVVSSISTGQSSSKSSGGGGGSITLPNGQVITTGGGSSGSSSSSRSTGHGLSIGEFEYLATQQPWFAHFFPGIFGPNGELNISPAQYNAQLKRYQAIASQFGRGLSRQEFGYALKKNVDAATFQRKLQAIQIVKNSSTDFQQFERTLIARGVAPKGGVKREDLYKFVMGEGPKAWNDVWEESWLRISAANAGLVTGRDIQRRVVLSIMQNNPDLAHAAQGGATEQVQAKFAQLAQDLRTVAPATRLFADHGLRPEDVAQIEFGGPRQAQLAAIGQRALASYKAALQPQARVELGALGQRVGQGVTKSAVTSPFETP